MQFLDMVLNFISQNLEAAASIIAVVIEFALRMFPSQKPLSLLYGLVGIIKLAGSIASKVADIMAALAKFLDKVLPQRLK
jgi:hypothetical protein